MLPIISDSRGIEISRLAPVSSPLNFPTLICLERKCLSLWGCTNCSANVLLNTIAVHRLLSRREWEEEAGNESYRRRAAAHCVWPHSILISFKRARNSGWAPRNNPGRMPKKVLAFSRPDTAPPLCHARPLRRGPG